MKKKLVESKITLANVRDLWNSICDSPDAPDYLVDYSGKYKIDKGWYKKAAKKISNKKSK